MAAKIRALQQWCKVQCDGYRDVSITNMTSSWKNGLAFCAIIHRFHPDLIDYQSLSKENIFENNKLAFDTAEGLGIAALLDPDDMVAMQVPDKLCIVTYLSQYYNHFRSCQPVTRDPTVEAEVGTTVGGPTVSVAVKRSADNTADDVIKRPALAAVKRDTLQQSAGARRNTWQEQCCVCHKKVYLMERHMNSNKLYHRQCFRHHERASSVTAADVDELSVDSTADVSHVVMSDSDRTDRRASAFVSSLSATKCSDTSSLSSTSKTDGTSCERSPPTHAVIAASSLSSCESSAIVSSEQKSVKPSREQQRVAATEADMESISQINTAAVDISAQDASASARQETVSSVGISQPTSSAVNVIGMSVHDAVSVEDNVPPEELVLGLPLSVESSSSQTKPAVSDAPELTQNEVESEITEDRVPGKPVNTLNVPASVSESSSSLSSVSAVAAAERVVESGTKDRVSPLSYQQARVDTSVITHQSACHSPTDNVHDAVSLSNSSPQPAVTLPTGTVSSTTHTGASAVVAPLSSELSCKTVNAVKSSHRLVAVRPAPPPPRHIQQNTSSNQQPTAESQLKCEQTTRTVTEPLESSQDVRSADDQVSSSKQSRQSTVRNEQQSSKETDSKHCEEQTLSEPSHGQPVPSPRRPRLSKLEVPSADAEICGTSLSSPESAVITKAAPNNATAARKSSPVPKPRKHLPTVVEDSEVLGKGKPDVAVKHGDIELSQTDRSQVKLKSGDSLLTESHMAAAAVEECGEQIPTARPRSPQIRSLGSSPVPCEGNKSPSLSPSLPVKYPRSKKRSAAPPPPMPPRPVSPKPPSPRPVSPKPPSPRPEARSVTKPEPQTLVPPQRPAAPRSPVGTSSQVTNKSSDRSPAANSEQSSVTVEPERVRRKITPDVKFTFENDVFRPAKTTATVDTSTSEQLKPSRPAPPRPAAASVTKRKVSAEEPLPVNFIKQKLAVLDAELKKLERDGCNMEDRIRSSAVDDDDIMMNDWLDMVQKKNELVREESELIYRLRQQELEDRHSQVEYELRRLMAIPEDKKTEEQKSRESELLQQLLVTVHRRNNIVDSMEEDRKRYLAEDEQISQMKATQGSDRKKKAG